MSSDEEFSGSENEEMELHLKEAVDQSDEDYDEEESDVEQGEESQEDDDDDENLIKLSSSIKKKIDSRKKSAKATQENEEENDNEDNTTDSAKTKKLSRSQKRKENIRKSQQDKSTSPVIYLGHIPHGFFEKQMRGYFKQFGTIKNLRLSRSKRTGKSKGYAFVEFEDPDVAAIVQETMNGYILFKRRLICKIVPEEKIHEKLWKGANKQFKPIPWGKINKTRHNRPKTAEQVEKITNRLLKKEAQKRKQLQELGIEYDFEGYAGQPRKKHTQFKD